MAKTPQTLSLFSRLFFFFFGNTMCRFLITGINLYNEFDLPHDEINPSAFKVNLIQHGPECQVLYKAVPY